MSTFKEPQFPALFVGDQANIRIFDRDLLTVLGFMTQNLKEILDTGISFDDNMDVSFVTATTHATINTEFPVTHGLGKAPTRYVVVGQSAAGSVYDGATVATKTTFYLKSNVSAKNFRLMFF